MRGILTAIAWAGVIGAANAEPPTELFGVWRTQSHGAHVAISDCGDGSPCGVLVWAPPTITNGVTRDERNPNQALRSRPLVGVPILWGLRASRDSWRDGRLYNPDTGQTFRTSMTPTSPRHIRLTGCLGPLCRSEIWTRVDAIKTGGSQ
jgi:uncharacterized protein (DUF2147 family)